MTVVAHSVTIYCRYFQLNHAQTVLDYGTGTMRNAVYLLDHGFQVYAADLAEQLQALRNHPAAARLAGLLEVGELEHSRLAVDLVLSTYVYNIIPQQGQRERYLDNVLANLRPGGHLLMEVSSRQDHTDSLGPCGDCAKSYSHRELDGLLYPRGFRRICHYYRHHAVAAIYRLAPHCEAAAGPESARPPGNSARGPVEIGR
jgi:SAM-dependent methyltransferase